MHPRDRRVTFGYDTATLRNMPNIRSVAIEDPLDLLAGQLDSFSTLIRRSCYAGLLPTSPVGSLVVGDFSQFCQQVSLISENMERVGLPAKASFHRLAGLPAWQGLAHSGTIRGHPNGAMRAEIEKLVGPLKVAVEEMNDQIEMSPQPAGEWEPAINTLGEELLAQLVGASPSSIRRYANHTRATPQNIAERLHFIAMLLADLAGSYNEFGIRRWFSRPRSALRGNSPAAVLGDQFSIDGESAAAVARLASALTGAGAA